MMLASAFSPFFLQQMIQQVKQQEVVYTIYSPSEFFPGQSIVYKSASTSSIFTLTYPCPCPQQQEVEKL